MRFVFIALLALLCGCEVDIASNQTKAFELDISAYPTVVKPRESFSLIIDALGATSIEADVVIEGEGIEIIETLGKSYLGLTIKVAEDAKDLITLRVRIRDGDRVETATLGFRVEP